MTNNRRIFWGILIALGILAAAGLYIFAVILLTSPTALPPSYPTGAPAATATFTPPSFTPEANLPTPIPGDPAQALGTPDSKDTFDNASNWHLYDNGCFKSEITGGKYTMTAKGLPGVLCWEVTNTVVKNFYLETYVQNPLNCLPDDRYGVFFRTPDNQRGYLFGISCDGRYMLTKWDGHTNETIIPGTTSDRISVGPSQINRIGVLGDGSHFRLYANGSPLMDTDDSAFMGPGKIGYFIQASNNQQYSSTFDDLSVWNLP
jgi:hypothetical protein